MPTAEVGPLHLPSPVTGPFPVTGVPDIDAAKRDLRAELAARRAALALAVRQQAALALARHLQAMAPPPGAVIAGFWPMRTEIDPLPLLKAAARAGHVLALPVVVGRDRPLVFRRYVPGEALEAGPHATRHPGPAAPELRPAVVLVPLLGFDRAGHRLGYGGGYYDRTLAALRGTGPLLAVGLAYACQEVGDIPCGGLDQRLDMILTENEVIVPPGGGTARGGR